MKNNESDDDNATTANNNSVSVRCLKSLALDFIVRNCECVAQAGLHLSDQYRSLILQWIIQHRLVEEYTILSPAALQMLLSEPLNVKEISLTTAEETYPEDFINSLARSLNQSLTALTLDCRFKFLSDSIKNLLCGLRHVRRLEIREMYIQNDELATQAFDSFHDLEHFSIQYYTRSDGLKLESIVNGNHRLKYFSSTKRGVSLPNEDLLLIAISRFLPATLTTLELNNFTCSKHILAATLSACNNIEHLKLSGSFQLDLVSMHTLGGTVFKWKSIDLSFKVTPPLETYQALQYLPATLESVAYRFGPSNRELICASLFRLPNLTRLLYHTEFFNDALVDRILSKLGTRLSYFDFGLADVLTDAGLASLTEHCATGSLTELDVHSDTNKYNRVCGGLTLVKFLETSAVRNQMTAIYLNYFKALTPQLLRAIYTNCHNLKELHLAGVRSVNDQFLLDLSSNCPNLSKLCIRSCWNVTDVGIWILARNLTLEYLDVAMCIRLTCDSLIALQLQRDSLDTFIFNGIPGIPPRLPDVERLCDLCWNRLRIYVYQWHG